MGEMSPQYGQGLKLENFVRVSLPFGLPMLLERNASGITTERLEHVPEITSLVALNSHFSLPML